MLLIIDAGNTNTVFALWSEVDQAWHGTWRSSTDPQRTADEYAVWLMQLMALQNLKPAVVTRVIISTVVPEALFSLRTLAQRYFHAKPLILGEPGCDLGIIAKIDTPSEAGADRLANSVAAHARYGGPLLVVDFGTATNVDYVDAEGNFAGGVIAPGINLSLQALYTAAAKLPRVGIAPTEKVLAKATVPAMQSGVYWGYVGLIEGLVGRLRAEIGVPLKVVATGGLAPMFASATSVIDHIDRDLTLWGLVLIARRNKM